MMRVIETLLSDGIRLRLCVAADRPARRRNTAGGVLSLIPPFHPQPEGDRVALEVVPPTSDSTPASPVFLFRGRLAVVVSLVTPVRFSLLSGRANAKSYGHSSKEVNE